VGIWYFFSSSFYFSSRLCLSLALEIGSANGGGRVWKGGCVPCITICDVMWGVSPGACGMYSTL
jgi:hypothetical protein